jgi:hypothetical protein
VGTATSDNLEQVSFLLGYYREKAIFCSDAARSLQTVQMVLSPHFEWRSHHKVAARVLSIGVNNSPGEWNNVVGEFL